VSLHYLVELKVVFVKIIMPENHKCVPVKNLVTFVFYVYLTFFNILIDFKKSYSLSIFKCNCVKKLLIIISYLHVQGNRITSLTVAALMLALRNEALLQSSCT